MQRESQEFTTSRGTKLVINSYLIARESNEIKSIMQKAMKINMAEMQDVTNIPIHGEVDGTFLMEIERKTVNFMVQSINGIIESAAKLELIESLPEFEYKEIVKKVNEITANLVQTK